MVLEIILGHVLRVWNNSLYLSGWERGYSTADLFGVDSYRLCAQKELYIDAYCRQAACYAGSGPALPTAKAIFFIFWAWPLLWQVASSVQLSWYNQSAGFKRALNWENGEAKPRMKEWGSTEVPVTWACSTVCGHCGSFLQRNVGWCQFHMPQ